MIVLLDVDKQVISLYREDGLINIPFQEVNNIYKYIKNNNVYYITNAIEVDVKDIVSMVRNMGIKVKEVKQEKLTYIHMAEEGVIPIDDKLRFRGKYDIHHLTDDLINKIKSTKLLTHLLEIGKLEMITSSRRKELDEERVRKEDEKFGGILVEGTVDEFMDKKDSKDSHDAISIDMDLEL